MAQLFLDNTVASYNEKDNEGNDDNDDNDHNKYNDEDVHSDEDDIGAHW